MQIIVQLRQFIALLKAQDWKAAGLIALELAKLFLESMPDDGFSKEGRSAGDYDAMSLDELEAQIPQGEQEGRQGPLLSLLVPIFLAALKKLLER